MKKLCFGSFATVLKHCMVATTSQKVVCGTMLLSIAPNYDIRTDDTAVSYLLSCRNGLSKDVTDVAPTADAKIVAQFFETNLLPLLDDNKRALMILAIKDIIANDDTIDAKTPIDKVNGTTKENLSHQTETNISEFLAGVFLYTVINVKNIEGKSSIGEITLEYVNSFEPHRKSLSFVKASKLYSAEFAVELLPDLTKLPSNTKDLLLLQEVESRCPKCQASLVLLKDGITLRNYQLVDLGLEVKSDKSQDSLLALCLQHGLEYASHHTESERQALIKLKETLVSRQRALESTNGIQVDEQIEDVLNTITTTPKKDLKLQMNPSEVEKKIAEDGVPLYIKISGYVRLYYRRVQVILQSLDTSGRLRSKEIAEDVRACYNKLKRESLTQEQIFDSLVSWLIAKSKPECRLACEILVSFFVQDCEVFDVITE